MKTERVSLDGRHLTDKRSHYELYTFIGPQHATIVVLGNIPDDFRERYRQNIRDCQFSAELDFIRNDEKLKECQDPFKPGSELYGRIDSIDQIIFE